VAEQGNIHVAVRNSGRIVQYLCCRTEQWQNRAIFMLPYGTVAEQGNIYVAVRNSGRREKYLRCRT
jgi:hypothetical protein